MVYFGGSKEFKDRYVRKGDAYVLAVGRQVEDADLLSRSVTPDLIRGLPSFLTASKTRRVPAQAPG